MSRKLVYQHLVDVTIAAVEILVEELQHALPVQGAVFPQVGADDPIGEAFSDPEDGADSALIFGLRSAT